MAFYDLGSLSQPYRTYVLASPQALRAVWKLRESIALLSIHQAQVALAGVESDQARVHRMWSVALGIASHIDPKSTTIPRLSEAGMPVFKGAFRQPGFELPGVAPKPERFGIPQPFSFKQLADLDAPTDLPGVLQGFQDHHSLMQSTRERIRDNDRNRSIGALLGYPFNGLVVANPTDTLDITEAQKAVGASEAEAIGGGIPVAMVKNTLGISDVRLGQIVIEALLFEARESALRHADSYGGFGNLVLDKLEIAGTAPERDSAFLLGETMATAGLAAIADDCDDFDILRKMIVAGGSVFPEMDFTPIAGFDFPDDLSNSFGP